jgi:hypothetical protein
MIGLEPVRFEKNWRRRTSTREENWDEIVNKITPFTIQTNNNFKQLGLDIDPNYQFNGVGRSTQKTPILSRISTLENTSAILGTRNIGLDLSDATKIKVIGADGDNLSSTNKGLVTFNSSADVGQLITRELTSNMELTLTGCHWGLDTTGDRTDFILWVMFIDTGSSVILGVAAQGGRQSVTTADDETSVGNVNSLSKVYVSSSLASENHVTYLGWVKADFDDTGNAGGENYWTVQSGKTDINIGYTPTYFEGTFVY